MTPLNDDNLKKVERALREAHQSRQEPSLGTDWSIRLMQDVRRKAKGHGPSMMGLGLDQLVWRTAAVAAAGPGLYRFSVVLHQPGRSRTRRVAVE